MHHQSDCLQTGTICPIMQK